MPSHSSPWYWLQRSSTSKVDPLIRMPWDFHHALTSCFFGSKDTLMKWHWFTTICCDETWSIKVGGGRGMAGWTANLQLLQAFRSLLEPLCTHDLVMALQRALTVMLEPEPFWPRSSLYLSAIMLQSWRSVLCLARAKHISCTYFLHMALSKGPWHVGANSTHKSQAATLFPGKASTETVYPKALQQLCYKSTLFPGKASTETIYPKDSQQFCYKSTLFPGKASTETVYPKALQQLCYQSTLFPGKASTETVYPKALQQFCYNSTLFPGKVSTERVYPKAL
jgi:hypothetical protein